MDVIVQFNEAPGDKHHGKVKAKGGVHKSTFAAIKAGHYSLPADAVEKLAADPDVVYIAPDRPVGGAVDSAAAAVGAQIALSYGFVGAGVGVAVLDTGLGNHPDFIDPVSGQSRVVYSESFTGKNGPVDNHGHGTHVGAILAGNGRSSSGSGYSRTLGGIAPKAGLINLRVLNSTAEGRDSWVIAGILRAIQLRSTYNIRVINLSLGRPIRESYTRDPLCLAVEAAWKAGIVVVVAAGNGGRDNTQGTNGYGTISSPGNDPYVLTVGAMKTGGTAGRGDDQIASYSSKGPTALDHVVKPDIVAPGNRVVAGMVTGGANLSKSNPSFRIPVAYYQNSTSNATSNFYFKLSGTSMATPVVSGAVALLLEKEPNLTPDQVKARLMKTASKAFPSSSTATDPVTNTLYTSYYDLFTVGAGYLDIWVALNNRDSAAGTALSPKAVVDPATGAASLVFGSNVVWGTNVIWGNSVVSGSNVVWGNNVVWGAETTQAEKATLTLNGET
jgi:serine protease AprX